ncbi:ImuA family protein [Mucilaginibacter xinganensis]|uniref:Protein ImuA n=1 Tax=Mucilaginibacter xinganensis TaxID=1234841 RepID=A0A223NX93_9SPHI|nr:Error-prone repair protein ImuA [Mucilaginibacter xinganensis]ASU34208.1 protein ImuA [Mucilaginibacter xinganensis]
MPDTKKDIINQLRKDILLWEGFKPPEAGNGNIMGLGTIEAAFPNGVFPTGAIHEMVCPTPEQSAATGGFMAGLLSTLMQQGGICLWIGTARKLFPPALMAFDVEPDRVIFIDVKREKDVLWATEEALKCVGLAAVVAELREISFAQSRRLQLAVENSRVTGFILRNDPRKLGSTTCVARWQVMHLPSELEEDLPGVGFPRWQVQLLKVRNGNPGNWQLEWADGHFVTITEKSSVNEMQQLKAG